MRTNFLSLAFVSILTACGAGAQSSSPDRAAPSGPAASPAAQDTALTYDVFTADAKGFFVTSTLVSDGKRAVLVDGQFNLVNGRRLASWIADKNVRLETIFITHAHPDHYFALGEVSKRFPGAKIVASPEVIRHMEQLGPQKLAYWGPIYKGDMPTALPVATPLSGTTITLGDHELRVVSVPQADSDPATVVHVPSLSLVIAGDLAYSGVHPWLADTPTARQRDAWIASIRTIQKLAPKRVVAGHKGPNATDDPSSLADTAAYIAAFTTLRGTARSAGELETALTKAYPDLALPIIAKLASQAAFAPQAAHAH